MKKRKKMLTSAATVSIAALMKMPTMISRRKRMHVWSGSKDRKRLKESDV